MLNSSSILDLIEAIEHLATAGGGVQATDSAMMKRRCRATEAVGLMATAIGREAVAPLVPDIMQAALKVGPCPLPPQ